MRAVPSPLDWMGSDPPPCLELELGASPEALVTTTVFKQFLCTCAGATLCVNCATCLIVQVVLWTWFPPGVPLSTPCPSCLLHPSPPPLLQAAVFGLLAAAAPPHQRWAWVDSCSFPPIFAHF